MGAGEFIKQLFTTSSRTTPYIRRQFLLRILTLFQTFRALPPFPENERSKTQESKFADIARRIGLVMYEASQKSLKDEDVNPGIEAAHEALKQYLKDYCSIDLQKRHNTAMYSARATDKEAVDYLNLTEKQLAIKMKELSRKPTMKIDLYVSTWSTPPYPYTHMVAGKIKIEEDATLSMLIVRYMDLSIHQLGHKSKDLLTTGQIDFLRLNPQIYRHFPTPLQGWTANTEHIKCVDQTITIRDYREDRDNNLFLVYDCYDKRCRFFNGSQTIAYTTAWYIDDKNHSQAVVRMNSTSSHTPYPSWTIDMKTLHEKGLDYTLYLWNIGKHLETLPDEFVLHSRTELAYVQPAPAFPVPQVSPVVQMPQAQTGQGTRANTSSQSVPSSASTRPTQPLGPPAKTPQQSVRHNPAPPRGGAPGTSTIQSSGYNSSSAHPAPGPQRTAQPPPTASQATSHATSSKAQPSRGNSNASAGSSNVPGAHRGPYSRANGGAGMLVEDPKQNSKVFGALKNFVTKWGRG